MSSANPHFNSPSYCKPIEFERFRNDAVLNQSVIRQIQVKFLGLWEPLSNPDFNPLEFDGIRIQKQIAIRQMQTLTSVSTHGLPVATEKKELS